MSLKTKRMKKILDPITAQINKLEEILSKNDKNILEIESVKSDLLGQLKFLSDNLKNISNDDTNDYEKTKDNITAIIEEFCCIKKVSPVEDNKSKIASDLLENFGASLRLLENLECLDLKHQLKDALEYVKEMGEVNEIEDFQNIKELGLTLVDMLNPLQSYCKNLISKLLKEKLALYICQLCTTFTMLAQLIEEQHNLNMPIYMTKKYICERTCWCIKMIIDILECDNPSLKEENEQDEEHFVNKMDHALDMITNFSGKKPDEQRIYMDDLWLAIEEVFSHAMAIAQVCQPENFNAITGVSQTIMTEFENLKEQITSDKPDAMLNSLFINTFTDALYRLERKVNISLLSLVLEVFHDPFIALKKLIQTCGNTLSADKRNKNDLNNGIEEFDQITDKAMQIGLYSIACCGDINRVAKIKNHMASLESLESELVPAIISFYLHPDNKEIRAGVKLLTNQWKIEIKKLHTAVDLIIDSSAYCQVVLDDLQDRVVIMTENLDNRRGINKIEVMEIVQRACTLATQVTDTVDDIGPENIDKQIKMTIRELKAAICELDVASKKFLNDNVTESMQLKVIKRCGLLLNVVKTLQPALAIVMNNLRSMMSISSKSRVNNLRESKVNFPSSINDLPADEKSITYVRTPYTVKSFKSPVSIQPANSQPKSPRNMSCLIPYIEKGRVMRTERSIMYKTPRNTEKKKLTQQSVEKREFNSRNLACVRQHLFSRDSFLSQSELNLSKESLDLTNILDKITGLSHSSSLNSTIDNQVNESVKQETNICSSLSQKNSFSKVIIADKTDNYSKNDSINDPSVVGTPERLTDIQRLDEKIQILQKHCLN